MKICVSIDSESYTTLYVDKVASVDEAVKTLLKREGNDTDLKLNIEDENNGVTRITLTNGEEYFVVANVFDMAPKRYATVWWHAYDGVNFDLKGASNDLAEAKSQMDFYIKNFWNEKGYTDEFYEEGSTFSVVDIGHEWECLEIVDLAESATLIIENPLVKEEAR